MKLPETTGGVKPVRHCQITVPAVSAAQTVQTAETIISAATGLQQQTQKCVTPACPESFSAGLIAF